MPSRIRPEAATAEDVELVAAIRAGDERAFTTLLDRHYGAMLAVANAYGLVTAEAERTVHEAWVAALAESEDFDGTVPLRTWLLRFAARGAASRAPAHDGLGTPVVAPAVEPDRFRGEDDAFAGHWRAYPADWRALPGGVLRGEDVRRVVEAALAELPVDERTVITLRDVLGCPAGDVCAVLGISDAAARAALHRARSRVRAALEHHFDA